MTATVLILLASTTMADVCWQGEMSGDLPQLIPLKTKSRTFTQRYYFALLDGKICYKKNPETTRQSEHWRPIHTTGLPQKKFDAPERITELTTDGDNIVALSETRRIYYAKIFNFKWTDDWGIWPKELRMPENIRGWSITHRGKDVDYYTDIDNVRHYVGFGVSDLYLLNHDGTEIRYNDPWLPANFDRFMFCTPQQGRFQAVSFQVSASTIFLIDQRGHMFTRLADYDNTGENPAIFYSYVKQKKKFPFYVAGKWRLIKRRRLPGEPWRRQPLIEGADYITDAITILQNGTGNSARELRVEGVKDGVAGYFKKQVFDGKWNFIATGLPITGNRLETGPQKLGPVKVKKYTGYLRTILNKRIKVEVEDFHPFCSPAKLKISYGTETVESIFHFRRMRNKTFSGLRRIVQEVRPLKGKGALMRPEDIGTPIRDAELSRAIKKIFSDKLVRNVRVKYRDQKGILEIKGRFWRMLLNRR